MMIFPLVACRSEPSAGLHVDLTSVNPGTGYGHSKYERDIPAVQYIQDPPGPEYKISTQHNESEVQGSKELQSIFAVPDCTGPVDEEASPGELVLTASSTQSQTPTEQNLVLAEEEAQREAVQHAEGDASILGSCGRRKKDDPRSDQMTLNETKCDFNQSLCTSMCLQGSPGFSGSTDHLTAPASLKQPSYMIFDASKGPGETLPDPPQGHKSGKGAAPSPESKPPQRCPPSLQAINCPPTFTNQRPAERPPAGRGHARSNTWTTRPPDDRSVGNINPQYDRELFLFLRG